MLTFEQYCKNREEMHEAWLGRNLGWGIGHALSTLGGGWGTNALTKAAGSSLGAEVESDMGALPGLFMGAFIGNLKDFPGKLSDIVDRVENSVWGWFKDRIFGKNKLNNDPVKINPKVVDDYVQAMNQLKTISDTFEFQQFFKSLETINSVNISDNIKGMAFNKAVINDAKFIRRYYNDTESIGAFLKILNRVIYNGEILVQHPKLNPSLAEKAAGIVSGFKAIKKFSEERLQRITKKAEEIIDLADVPDEPEPERIPEKRPDPVRMFNSEEQARKPKYPEPITTKSRPDLNEKQIGLYNKNLSKAFILKARYEDEDFILNKLINGFKVAKNKKSARNLITRTLNMHDKFMRYEDERTVK